MPCSRAPCRGIEAERVLDIHSPHLQSLPDRDSNSQPFKYESDSLPLSHDFSQNYLFFSAFNPSKVNTPPEQWVAIYFGPPGEQLGVQCLAQGHLSQSIEGGESAGYPLPPTKISDGPETRTHNL